MTSGRSNHRLHAHMGTLRQLEILLMVYETGSIKAASESLFLTQPTVSMQLKKLAETIEMPLYDIVGRKLVFTQAGQQLVETAREVMNSFSRLDANLSKLRGLKAGRLNLAVVTTSNYIVPHLLGPFCKKLPGVDVQLKVGNRQQIIERLKAGMDDFYVFSHPPDDMDIDQIEFLVNPLVAIADQGHPLATKATLTLQDIGNENFIMREVGSGTRHAIQEFLAKQGLDLNIRMTIESNEAIKHAVMSGLGISILSAHTLVFGGSTGLSQLAVKELPIKTHWYFVWLKAKRHSLIAEEFLKHVETEGRAMLIEELRRNGIREDDITS